MSNLAELQQQIASALLSAEQPVPGLIAAAQPDKRAERRFAVYRNNVIVGLVNALAARFPVTLRLVGEEFFRAMARRFVEHAPPRSPIMLHYGAGFPDFIDCFEPAASVPYLGDVARLERARGVAYHAADVPALELSAFADLTHDRLDQTRIRLHPSVSVISSCFPIVSIWTAHQDAETPVPLASWEPEGAVAARPDSEVVVISLPPGVAVCLRAIQTGEPLGAAMALGTADDARFDPAAAFALIIGARLAIALR